jgi:predicted Zn-dependent protease
MADTPRIEELKRRVQSDPASIAFAALAEEFRRAGRFEEAIATCTAGLVRHPSYLSAHVTLGRSLIEVGRFEDAREELEHVLRLAPENLAAIRGLAEIHHRRGDQGHEQYTDADVARYAAEGDAAHAAEAALQQAASHASPAAPEVAQPRALQPEPPAAAPAVRQPVATPPALAGLEQFLHAIVRTRTERAITR